MGNPAPEVTREIRSIQYSSHSNLFKSIPSDNIKKSHQVNIVDVTTVQRWKIWKLDA